jgi:flagellar basal-body rod protein FlgG
MMLEGLYAAASGMEAQQHRMDAVSNDLANVSTAGYQATEMGFHDLLYSSGGASSGSSVATGAGSAAVIVGRSQIQGAVQETGRPLDVAILGPGYLQVRRPDGTLGLTRNGTLQLNSQGQVTNELGMVLQPPITVPRGTQASEIKIAPNGGLLVGGRTVGTLQVVTVTAPDGLLPAGDSTFVATAASGAPRPATGTRLQQGALTASNVDVATAMTQMIDAEQSYSMGSKAIQFQDQMLGIANGVKK